MLFSQLRPLIFGALMGGCSNPAQPTLDENLLPQRPESYSQALTKVGQIVRKNEVDSSGPAYVILPEDHRSPVNHFSFTSDLKNQFPGKRIEILLEGIVSDESERKKLESWKTTILSTGKNKVDTGFDAENSKDDVLQNFEIDDSGTINFKNYKDLGIDVIGLESYPSQKANLTTNLYNHCLDVVETIHKAVKSTELPIEFRNENGGIPRVFVVMRNIENSFANQGFPTLSSYLSNTNRSGENISYKISPDDGIKIEVARKKLSEWMLKTVVEKRNNDWIEKINSSPKGADIRLVFCGSEHVTPEASSPTMSIPNLLGSQSSWYVLSPNKQYFRNN